MPLYKYENEIFISQSTVHEVLREYKEVSEKQMKCKYKGNQNTLDKLLSDAPHEVSFSGGTVGDVFKDPDLREFNRVKNEIKSAIYKNKEFRYIIGTKPTRRRYYNDKDGDWDFDRRFDINQFQSTKKIELPIKTIEVLCDFSIHCGISSDQINRYGAICWALINVIESFGIQVKVVLFDRIMKDSFKGWYDPGGGKTNHPQVEMRTLVKNYGEYMPAGTLARAFGSNFYRRAKFFQLVKIEEHLDVEGSGSLGTPLHFGNIFKVEKGKVYLGADLCYSDKNEILHVFKKVLGELKGVK